MKTMKIYAMLVFSIMLASCEKVMLDEAPTSDNTENCNVVIHATSISQKLMTSRATSSSLSEVATRLTCAFFSDGEKKKNISQTIADDDFGTVSLNLPKGNYELVVIAHNGAGNCTISSTSKVTFYKNKVTDTFYYYGTLEVDDEKTEKEITLERPVGMFRLCITDTIPSDAAELTFKYTGGSSTFNPSTGYGSVNSRQTETRTMSTVIKNYDFYTFPHSDGKNLSITATVTNSLGDDICERELTEIPIQRNTITTYSGAFFSKSGNFQLKINVNATWEGENKYDF